MCQQGLCLFPEDIELRFRQAVLCQDAGRLAEAATIYQSILHDPVPRYFSSLDQGLRSYKARQNLALLYSDQGDLKAAEEQWRQVTATAPHYRPGYRGLGDILLRQGNKSAVRALAEQLLHQSGLSAEGYVLQGQLAALEGDVVRARAYYRQADAVSPQDNGPWQALCQFLFEQGTPAEAAEALEELTRREPANAAAFHNLGTIYRRLERPADAVRAYQESLRLRPGYEATLASLAQVLEE